MNPLLFTDPAFLFCFAPVVLTLYYVMPASWRNGFVLAASILLDAWGEGRNVALLVTCIVVTYGCGLMIERQRSSSRRILAAGVIANLLLLAFFKYSTFVVGNADLVIRRLGLPLVPVPTPRLPVGVSFFTFMAISYLVDVYRRQVESEKNPATFGLYLAMFPHLIAGPIVRFEDIVAQIRHRSISTPEVTQGIRRFVIGFGKKVLIGNTVAATADKVFALSPDQLSAPLAWLGVVCYTVQIYFDFSGYSDMAIGLAAMLGFRFPENFNYPYISESIVEFWRRWHMSLTTWLRDYLFFPLGVRGARWKLYRNTLVVFITCGLWHGAAWHFVLWGMFHGALQVVERMGLAAVLAKTPRALRHAYTLVAIMIGWVLFRVETILGAGAYVAAMFGLGRAQFSELAPYLPPDVMLALAVGIVASMPLRMGRPPWEWTRLAAPAAEFAGLACVFLLSLAVTAAGTYKPFIYFRF